MIQYATPAELAHHLDPDSTNPEQPKLATVLLRRASELVQDATLGAIYPTTAEGYPADELTAAAMRDATCEQAAAWALHGIDPRKGAAGAKLVVTSKSLLGGTVNYGQPSGVQGAIEQLSAGNSLSPAAWQILNRAGLISTRITAGSTSAYVAPADSRPYDPTTGRFVS